MRWVFNLQFCSSDSVVFVSGMSALNVIPSVIRLKLPSHQMPAWSSGISQFEVSLFCRADPTPERTGASNCLGVSQDDPSTMVGASGRKGNLWAGWCFINDLKRRVLTLIWWNCQSVSDIFLIVQIVKHTQNTALFQLYLNHAIVICGTFIVCFCFVVATSTHLSEEPQSLKGAEEPFTILTCNGKFFILCCYRHVLFLCTGKHSRHQWKQWSFYFI